MIWPGDHGRSRTAADKIVRKVDKAGTGLVSYRFARMGFDAKEAEARARAFHNFMAVVHATF
jgi:hypothetical protein